jgi:cation diffusion facilitator family transporter
MLIVRKTTPWVTSSFRAIPQVRWHGGNSHGAADIEDQDLAKEAERITYVGVVANLGLTGGKAVVGTMTGSASLTADAMHSFSDLLSDAVALVALKFSAKPKDQLHPFGYGNYETVGTLGVAALLLFGSVEIAHSAVESLVEMSTSTSTPALDFPLLALAAATISVGTKEALFQATLTVGQKARSSVVIANAWHHRSDSLSSVVAIGGIGGTMVGMPYMDAVGGLLVSALIAKTGVDIGWGAIKALTDRQDNVKVMEGVREIGAALTAEGVLLGVRRVRCRQLGSYCLVDLFVVVEPGMLVGEAHARGDLLRGRVMAEHAEVHDVMVHVCPPDAVTGGTGGGISACE